jgi:hypothetical protein
VQRDRTPVQKRKTRRTQSTHSHNVAHNLPERSTWQSRHVERFPVQIHLNETMHHPHSRAPANSLNWFVLLVSMMLLYRNTNAHVYAHAHIHTFIHSHAHAHTHTHMQTGNTHAAMQENEERVCCPHRYDMRESQSRYPRCGGEKDVHTCGCQARRDFSSCT